MDLRHELPKSATECYVCRHSRKDAVLWPQEPTSAPRFVYDEPIEVPTFGDPDAVHQPRTGTWSMGEWKVYLTSYTQELRSGRLRINVCVEHYNELGRNWIAIAQCEVDLENQWHSYIDRMER